MLCRPIVGLKLDEKSQKTFKKIRETRNLKFLLKGFLNGGVIVDMFTKSRVLATHNIKKTDWNLFRDAMNSLPDVISAAIKADIRAMTVYYKNSLNYDSKHVRFWEGLYYGCK